MEKQLPISVCMSMYNVAPYVGECIDSILAQTFEDFELLIVDDGSDDDSAAIVRSYTDKRIKLIEREHDYIASLNYLLSHATGKYIARMDADDIMLPYRLERQFAYMETHPDVDILGGAIQCIGIPDNKIISYKEDFVTVGDLLNGTVLANPTVMMRAKSVADLRYDLNSTYADDYQFWCQALKAGLKMMSIRDVIGKYRITGTNVSFTHREEQRMAALRAKEDLEEWVTASEASRALPINTTLPPSSKELTIIITFLNEGDELEKTVSGIRKTVADSVEIIVINDCSFDGYDYGESLEKYNVHYFVNRHRLGVAASRDFGVSKCKTPYFLLLDAHMRFYDQTWANCIVKALQEDDRQLLCCQGRFLYKDTETGEVEENEERSFVFGAYSPFGKDSVWPDITWNYKEFSLNQRTQDIPSVLGAAYATSKTYWTRLRGLEGLRNYGADEQFISLKVWCEGGRCTLLKDVVIGHIYRKRAPYLILGKDTIYNLMYIARLLFPVTMYSMTVAQAMVSYRNFAYEALEAFKEHEIEIEKQKTYFASIFTRKIEEVLLMHQACREYDSEAMQGIVTKLPEIAQCIQTNVPVDDGLMEGKTGIFLWLLYYQAFCSSFDNDEILDKLYTDIEKDVNKHRLPWNFRYGLTGIGWGMLYLYNKGLLKFYPEELINGIDSQLLAISPENIEDMSLDTGVAGVLAYLSIRLTIKWEKKSAQLLDKWNKKALEVLAVSNQREAIYYAYLYNTIYEKRLFNISLMPLIGVWLKSPSYVPRTITIQNCTLVDGILGTTLQTMLLLKKQK